MKWSEGSVARSRGAVKRLTLPRLRDGTGAPLAFGNSTLRSAEAFALGPVASNLGAVLSVVDHVPGDERPTDERGERERSERRKPHRRRDQQQHRDARGEAPRADPTGG